jgi:hypothetical protein
LILQVDNTVQLNHTSQAMDTHDYTVSQNHETPLPTFGLSASDISRLAPLFQHGVRMRVASGISVSDFLVDELGVAPDYVRSRITTVFLNGSVVDNMETARLSEGSCLALSAAMPGLVGATLRTGGYYASMRESITLIEGQASEGTSIQSVQVTVKLFNLLIVELGPTLLAHGVALPFSEAVEFLGEQAFNLLPGSPDVWLRAVTR